MNSASLNSALKIASPNGRMFRGAYSSSNVYEFGDIIFVENHREGFKGFLIRTSKDSAQVPPSFVHHHIGNDGQPFWIPIAGYTEIPNHVSPMKKKVSNGIFGNLQQTARKSMRGMAFFIGAVLAAIFFIIVGFVIAQHYSSLIV